MSGHTDHKLQDAMDEALESVSRNEHPHKKHKPGHAKHDEQAAEPAAANAKEPAQAKSKPGADETPATEIAAAETPDPRAKELEEQKQEVARLKDRLLRTAADFENYRKRSQREQDDARQYGAQKLLADLLPVVDNLERALAHEVGRDDPGPHYKTLHRGLELVQQQMLDTLKRHGVTRFDAKGQPFDPNLHEAVGQVQSDDVPAGQVAEQHQAGYKYHERLLRPAMVMVAIGPTAASSSDPTEQEPSEE